MSLKDLQEGDVAVRALTGGGFTTQSLVEIETINEQGIFIEGCDGDFSHDSIYQNARNTPSITRSV